MTTLPDLPSFTAHRYVQPLREGGSLPAVVDTDGGLFVVKFRGSGQGAKALVAELIVGLLASAVGLPTPALALVEIPAPFGRAERDPEIQDVLRGSHGVNVGMRYLDGAFNFDPSAAADVVSAELAAGIVWLDAFVTNPDRTPRNPNLLVWDRHVWLIDHGAALYVHHDWDAMDEARVHTPFPRIREHVLITRAGDLAAADGRMLAALDAGTIDAVLGAVPDALLAAPPGSRDALAPDAARERYRRYLLARLAGPRAFVAEAAAARDAVRSEPPRPLSARR